MKKWREFLKKFNHIGTKLKKKKPRAIIFFDQANIFSNLQLLRVRIDHRKFKEDYLGRKKKLVGALMYRGEMQTVSNKNRCFNDYLKSIGYVILTRPVVISNNGKKIQKDLDIKIASDLKNLAKEDAFDIAILVSGDGDFSDVIDYLKARKKNVVIWSFKRSLSRKLVENVDSKYIKYIDDVLDKIIYKPINKQKSKAIS